MIWAELLKGMFKGFVISLIVTMVVGVVVGLFIDPIRVITNLIFFFIGCLVVILKNKRNRL